MSSDMSLNDIPYTLKEHLRKPEPEVLAARNLIANTLHERLGDLRSMRSCHGKFDSVFYHKLMSLCSDEETIIRELITNLHGCWTKEHLVQFLTQNFWIKIVLDIPRGTTLSEAA